MTALDDVQKALNLIRSITDKEQATTKLKALELMSAAVAGELVRLRVAQQTKPKAVPKRAAVIAPPKPSSNSEPPAAKQVAAGQDDTSQVAQASPNGTVPKLTTTRREHHR